jgi:glycogen synthase
VTRGLEGAGAVIAPTAAMMRSLRSHYGPLSYQVVVPNGAYAPVGPPSASKERAVLAAGRLWDRARNLESLARVAPGFAGPVRVAGPNRLLDGSFCSFPNVEILGWLDGPAMGRAMDAAAIFAHPARYEPFGLTPLEAALRRCALVLGNIDSLREVWGDAAFYVDPNDDDALAAALDAFACDEEMRREHAERAAARAATFTPERMMNETVAVYSRLLSSQVRSFAPQAGACDVSP